MQDERRFRGIREPRSTTRRELIAGALGTGFALAVRPVSAETITTGTDGLDVADVRIPTSAGEIPAYPALCYSRGRRIW